MKQCIAFTKKEITETIRTGKLVILIILFALFGIMNPAIAKLTPWLMEKFAKDIVDTGILITEMKVDALTSWEQFYKNIPIALFVFIIIISGTFTTEYQKGTLVNMLTKGLTRWKIIIAKTGTAIILWTICYWMCFGITYSYNAYFWDNKIVSHLYFSVFCMYLLGIWLITMIMFVSALVQNNSSVLIGTAGIFLIFYFASFISPIKRYLPIQLLTSSNLLYGINTPSEYLGAIWITILLAIFAILTAILFFNKKVI